MILSRISPSLPQNEEESGSEQVQYRPQTESLDVEGFFYMQPKSSGPWRNEPIAKVP